MNVLEILTEERRKINSRTYEDVAQVTRKVGNFLKTTEANKKTKGNFTSDITDVIPKIYNPFNKKVIVKYSNISISKKKNQNHVLSQDGKTITLVLNWHGTFTENWTEKGRTYTSLVTLKHEMVHILDYLEMTANEVEWMNRESNSKASEVQNSVTYYKDPFEFNQVINMIKEYKRLQPRSWEKITTYDKLYSIIEKHGRGYYDFDDLIKSNYDFKMKFKARLKRDNLIPPNLKR